MAHFAQIGDDGLVDRVVVISNEDLFDENGVEQESLGVAICQRIYGGGEWAQTSYNGNKNGQFAEPGFIYDRTHHVFRQPNAPFPSWTVSDTTGLWEAPVPKPDSEFCVEWDEDQQTWIEKPWIRFVDGEQYTWNTEQEVWLVYDYEAQVLVPAEVQFPAP
jgi:hypothetical protein